MFATWCRAVGSGHDSTSLNSTLRHIKKELGQSQAEHDRRRPAATAPVTGPATFVPAEGLEPAAAEQSPADVAAARPHAEADSDSSDDTADSASTRYARVQHQKVKLVGMLWLIVTAPGL